MSSPPVSTAARRGGRGDEDHLRPRGRLSLYLYLTPNAGEDGTAVATVEIAPNVNADYDGSGTLLGIEVLAAGGLSVETLAAGAMAKTNEAA